MTICTDGHTDWCERNCDTTRSGEHACVVFDRNHPEGLA